MKIKKFIKLSVVLLFLSFTTETSRNPAPPLHEDFVLVTDVIPGIKVDLRYYGSNNFVGRPLPGYNQPKCYLTKDAAAALKRVQDGFERLGFGLLIYDAYRPQIATDYLVQWAKDEGDTLMKETFYPSIDKKDLFNLGYISEKSGHSRGSTIDLTIVSLTTGKVLNMGSSYDLFDEKSGINYEFVTKNQKALRLLLKRRMEAEGFKGYDNEWWHFTLENEPYPKTYFAFPIE
jgi:D-alanyl-D-alanine dipeptidase